MVLRHQRGCIRTIYDVSLALWIMVLKKAVWISVCSRHVQIQNELARVAKEIRKTRRRQNRQVIVPAALWRVATIVFAFTHPDVEPAAAFLGQRWKHWSAEHHRMRTLLQGWSAQLLLTLTVATVLEPATIIWPCFFVPGPIIPTRARASQVGARGKQNARLCADEQHHVPAGGPR